MRSPRARIFQSVSRVHHTVLAQINCVENSELERHHDALHTCLGAALALGASSLPLLSGVFHISKCRTAEKPQTPAYAAIQKLQVR